MKRRFFLCFISIMLIVVFWGGVRGFALSEPDSTQKKIHQQIRMPLSADELLENSIKATDVIKNEAGQSLSVYSDSYYKYYVPEGTKEIAYVVLLEGEMEKLDSLYTRKYSSEKNEANKTISKEEADRILQDVILKLFPEYNNDDLYIQVDSETGSFIEYYRYHIEEVHDETRVNTAAVSLAFNGQIAMASGSHNTADMFDVKSNIKSDDVLNIVSSYMIDHKEEVEKSISQPIAEDFKDASDLIEPSIIKVMRKGDVVWEASFTVKTSRGDYDELISPRITAYINAESGEIVELLL